ncbi:hypothetical protein MKX08_003941 [Trichoderma sp. CBMAI-0020]|nr:hypothetical protein MKX08_003941 [Trichoderma sp. CBMAI-0020]
MESSVNSRSNRHKIQQVGNAVASPHPARHNSFFHRTEASGSQSSTLLSSLYCSIPKPDLSTTMSTAARRRLMRDFKRMQTDPPAGVSASPIPDNVMTWNAVIIGPADTPFEDGTFRLVMQFEEQYPNKPPQVKFISQMFHPNVYATGELCLDILQNRWSPTYDVAAVLTSIQSLLNDPNTGSPANVEASNLYKDNRKEYTKRVRATVESSWED